MFRRLNCWLQNKPYPEPESYSMSSIEELFDREDPWQTRIYWSARRTFKRIVGFPGNTYRHTKWFIQRGRRGWADCDTWSVDDYLNGWLPDALGVLKKHKHGTPMSMFTEEEASFEHEDGMIYPPKEALDRAKKEWDECLQKMIDGFLAAKRLGELNYSPELGPYPLRREHKDLTPEQWDDYKDAHMQRQHVLMERDQKMMEEGLALFSKHYQSLWD